MTTRESTSEIGNNASLTLSRFEKHRASHPVFPSELPTPSSGIVVEKFRSELSCKICHNLLNDPVLSRTCMHRFCTTCVVDGTKIIVSSCPDCGAKFSGNPAFLKDHNFTEIIKKLMLKECDTRRRNIITVLKATGIDVDGYFRNNGKVPPSYQKDNHWTNNYATTSNMNEINFGNQNNINGNCFKSKEKSNGINRNYMWKLQMKNNDVIHLNTEYGSLQLTMEQFENLPFILDSSSVKPITSGNIQSVKNQVYSLCNNMSPAFVAELDSVYVPRKIPRESKKLLMSLPMFILKLFPKDFRNLVLKEKEQIPDEPILTHRQLINRGMCIGIILLPDSSVIKFKLLPKCLKYPRYIYGPPFATVNHLKEFLYTRAQVEADFYARDKFLIQFASVIKEKKEINLRITSENDSGSTIANNAPQKGEFLLKVQCGQSNNSKIKKRETLIIIKHPFQCLNENLNIKDLTMNSRIIGRPLKIVFRIIPI